MDNEGMREARQRPRTVLVAVDDLFFWTKIETAARHAGIHLEHAADAVQVEESLGRISPDLIIMDLNSGPCDSLNTIRKMKSRPELSSIPIVGFLSHVQIELERAAREAGCDRVLPRSRFSANLAAILQIGRS